MVIEPGEYEIVFPRKVQILYFSTIEAYIRWYFREYYEPITREDSFNIRWFLIDTGQIRRVALGRYRVPKSVTYVRPPPEELWFRNIGAYIVDFGNIRLATWKTSWGLDIKAVTETRDPCDNYEFLHQIAESIYVYSKEFWAERLSIIERGKNYPASETNEEIPEELYSGTKTECDKPRFVLGFFERTTPDELIYFASGTYYKHDKSKIVFKVEESDTIYSSLTKGKGTYRGGSRFFNYFPKGQLIEVFLV